MMEQWNHHKEQFTKAMSTSSTNLVKLKDNNHILIIKGIKPMIVQGESMIT
jgi:hypothetical protein